MIKKIFTIFIILTLLYTFQSKAVSYDTFGGRYQYNQNNDMPYSSYYSEMKDEEILIIVDYSASMNQQLGMSARYIQAIDAINRILQNVPNETKIGLRVFGITNTPAIIVDADGNGRFNRKEICSASKLVLPISSYNNSNIVNSLSELRPRGATPIGYSLREAIKHDFVGSSGLKHIILITDGRENCGDDPCRYIKQVMSQRNDILIDVIGITVDPNAYSQLSCIAGSANGRFYNANNPEELNTMFKNVFSSHPVNIQNPSASFASNPDYEGDNTYRTGFAPPPSTAQFSQNSNYTHYQTQKRTPVVKYNNYSFEFDM